MKFLKDSPKVSKTVSIICLISDIIYPGVGMLLLGIMTASTDYITAGLFLLLLPLILLLLIIILVLIGVTMIPLGTAALFLLPLLLFFAGITLLIPIVQGKS
jgi:hypothetical protein